MMFYIYGAGLILLQFTIRFAPISAHKMSKEILFFTLVVASLFFYQQKSKLKLSFSIPIILFFFLCYFNTNDFTQIYFWTQFQAVSFFIIMFYLVSSGVGSNKVIRFFIAASCLIESIWCLSEKFGFNPYQIILNFISNNYHVSNIATDFSSGSLNQPNSSGAYIAVSSIFLLRSKIKWFFPISILAVFTTSSMPIITMILSVFYFFGLKKQIKYFPYFAFITISTCLIIFGFPNNIDNGRWEVWNKIIELNEKLFFGYGLGDFALNFHNKAKIFVEGGLIFRNAHSEYLQSFYNFGLIGSTFVFYLFFNLTRTYNRIYLSALFAIFVNCFGNFFFHAPQLSYLACLIFALSYRESV